MKRKMVAEHCKREEAHKRKVKLLALARNSDFVKWDQDMAANRDWNIQIFNMSPELLAFTLNGQANTLPSPSNLRRWGLHSSTHHCVLCGKLAATAKHIESHCPVAVKGGRYTWRHNNVLRTLFPDLMGLVNTANRSAPKSRSSNHRQPFVREGAKLHVPKPIRPTANLLDLADDWILLVDDIPFRTVFPLCIGVDTTQRPDIIIYSKSKRIIIWGELTVPRKENINAAAIRKRNRYSVSTKKKLSLKDKCKRNKWEVHDFTFEVGLMGWVGYSTRRFLSKLGFKSSHLKWLLSRISRTAMRSSYLIWCCRKERTWEPPEMVPLRVPTANLHIVDPSTAIQQTNKESSREAALNFLATFNANAKPNPISPPQRPPQPRYNYDSDDEYETLAEEAEEFDDHRPPSPFEPDGPDAEPEHMMLP